MELTDKGPWAAGTWSDGRVVIQSDDFNHDVALIVTGNFADDSQRMNYARALAAQINAGTTLLNAAQRINRVK